MFGREKTWGESDWKRRLGYFLLGELHIPGRLRTWHIISEFRRLGLWSARPLTLLDAGGGEGAFAYFVARKFPTWTVVVADNDIKALARGQKIKSALGLENLEMRHVDLYNLEEESMYDVVVCSDVLEHIEQDGVVVKQFTRALKPGGVVILTSPSVPQPKHLQLVAWREHRIGFNPSDYGHVRQGYTQEGFHQIIRNAGLDLDKIRWIFGRFGTLMFDLFFITGDSRPNPIVYLALFPLYMTLSVFDVCLPVHHGGAILGVGRKP